ncbi:MAG: hypothetical protein GPJ54_02680 [Candidatus Heimdallarchaeota archaeon]|nr:hypothetical protein [Candidatus Heimdallarchaeota archaeon]
MFVYIAVFLPIIQQTIVSHKERSDLMNKIIKRLSFWMILSSILVSISGMVLIPKDENGVYLFLKWFDFYSVALSIKIILSILMVVLIILKLKKIDKIPKPEIRKKWIYRAIYFNLFLGVVVVIISIIIRGYNPSL